MKALLESQGVSISECNLVVTARLLIAVADGGEETGLLPKADASRSLHVSIHPRNISMKCNESFYTSGVHYGQLVGNRLLTLHYATMCEEVDLSEGMC